MRRHRAARDMNQRWMFDLRSVSSLGVDDAATATATGDAPWSDSDGADVATQISDHGGHGLPAAARIAGISDSACRADCIRRSVFSVARFAML